MPEAANRAADEVVINDTDDLDNDGMFELEVISDDSFGSSTFGGKDSQKSAKEDYQTSEEVEALRRDVQALRQQNDDLSGRASKAEQEKLETEREKRKIGKMLTESVRTNLESTIESLQQQLVKAKEDGDSRAEVDLEGKLARNRADLAKIESTLDSLSEEPARDPEKKQTATENKAPDPGQRAASEWVARNQWYGEPASKEEEYRKNLANRINRAMLQENKYDPTTPEYYKEVDRRLAMEEEKQNPNRRSSVAGVNNSSAGGNPNNGKERLTVRVSESEKEMMRQLRLNPDDPKHLKAYAKEKVRVDRRWGDDEPFNPQTL